MTIEDEYRQANLVDRVDVEKRRRVAAQTAKALLQTGQMKAVAAIPIVAKRLKAHSSLMTTVVLPSRDFQ